MFVCRVITEENVQLALFCPVVVKKDTVYKIFLIFQFNYGQPDEFNFKCIF